MATDEPPSPPTRNLAFLAAAGPEGFFAPPPQTVVDGISSWLNQPFAMSPGNRLLRLDVHVPANSTSPLPVVVFTAGGSWLLVAKNHAPWLRLLDEGYAVVSVEYRLSGEARYPAQVHDIKAAVRWTRANAARFGLDPERIGAWGCSAGGYLAAMAGATNDDPDFEGTLGEDAGQSSALSCIITQYGPCDLLMMSRDTNGIDDASQPSCVPDSPEAQLLGFVPSDDPDRARNASVTAHVAAATVPFLIMHGDADTMLGVRQSRRLRDSLQGAGAAFEYLELPGANHGDPRFSEGEAMDIVTNFLARHL